MITSEALGNGLSYTDSELSMNRLQNATFVSIYLSMYSGIGMLV